MTSGARKLLTAGTSANAEYVARGFEYMDHTASDPSASTSNAVTAANERLKARRGLSARDWARCQTAMKLGIACSSASLASLNSARIFLSSPIVSITNFHSRQRLAQLLLAALV